MLARFKQPKNLEVLAIGALGEWVALQAEQQMNPISTLAHRNTKLAHETLEKIISKIRQYLDYNVPWMLQDEFADETIRALSNLLEKSKKLLGFRPSMGKFVSQMNVIVKMTEVLFTKNLTYVSVDIVPKMLRAVFYSKLNMLTGLVYLNLGSLSGGWKTADMESTVTDAIKNLHSLEYFIINYDCTDTILRCLVDNSKKLKKLDVSSSKCITNESIPIITQMQCLKSVQLYRTSVTLEGFAKLLVGSKYLEDIGRCDEIGRVLEYIDLTNSEARPFHLKSFVSRYAPNHHLQIAVEMCPYIRNMTVFHSTMQSDLMVLIGLKDLCELKILSCDFYADQVKQLLQVKGCNLTHLHLEHIDQIDLNALMYISQMCPFLQSLTLYNCTLIQHTSISSGKLEILPFRNLKRLTCVSTCTDDQLMFMLSNCLNVEFIHIGTAVQLTDDFLLKVLNKNPLIHLNELRIMQSDFLTVASAERIIQSCMNLKILVELESWSLLSDLDRENIKNFVKINNFNIDTDPIRRYDM